MTTMAEAEALVEVQSISKRNRQRCWEAMRHFANGIHLIADVMESQEPTQELCKAVASGDRSALKALLNPQDGTEVAADD